MIFFFFFPSILFIPSFLTDCPNNKNFGSNCQNNCTNCLNGCDITGACINSTCKVGYYGSGCTLDNIFIVEAPTLIPNNCSINIESPTFNRSSINPTTYYLVYSKTLPSTPTDYTKWESNIIMKCTPVTCSTSTTILGGIYYFGVYFDFIDTKFGNAFQSLVSSVSNSTCNTSSTIFLTTLTSTSLTSTISTTRSSASTNAPINMTVPTPSGTVSPNPSIGPTNGVLSLRPLNKSSTHIYVTWQPPNNGIQGYRVIVQNSISSQIAQMNTNNTFQNITGLLPGNKYNIIVTTIYGISQSVDVNITVCTSPLPEFIVDNVKINSIYRKSLNVTIPIDRTNYTCSKNVLVVAIVAEQPSNRKKRSPSSIIPPTATIIFNGTSPSPPITIDNLNSLTNYTIYTQIYANVDGSQEYYTSLTYAQTNGPTDGAIVGIVIGILLLFLLIALIILLLFWIRKKKQRSYADQYYNDNVNTLKEIVDENKPSSFAYWSEIYDNMEPRYLSLNKTDWREIINSKSIPVKHQNYNTNGVRFAGEFLSLPDHSSYSHMASEANHVKNKRQDIFPYDHNRVILKTVTNNQSDYINASFIDGYLRSRAYIASQSPFDKDTTKDFWKMIYENNVGQIIMLTEIEYDNQTKSTIYWPQYTTKYNLNETIFGQISVRIISETHYAWYDIREFEIKDIDYMVQPQLVKQYQFHGWSDNNIPDNIIAFLDFYQAIKINADISDGQKLVHCGTGICQTAVYIAFDILNTQVMHENCVNVFRTVAQMRRSRSNMIRNSKQYMLIYDLLFEALLCGQFIVNTNVKSIYKLLHKVNPQSQFEYIKEQFYLLQTYNMVTTCHQTHMKDVIFVDSVERLQNISSISSPSANINNIEQFWSTVINNKIEVIIDLKTIDDQPYYIREIIESFEIKINNCTLEDEYFRKWDVSLSNLRHGNRCNISIYQLGTNWVNDINNESEPHKDHCLVWSDLIHELVLNHSRDRIMVHCFNGYAKSGLFLSCFNVALKMFNSKYVMVYNIVKSLKFYRPEYVTSFSQYQFIYHFLKKYVDSKMANDITNECLYSGLLPSGDKLKESLFTHEQTPVLRPEQIEKYAPTLLSLESREYNYDTNTNDDAVVVHYNVGEFSNLSF